MAPREGRCWLAGLPAPPGKGGDAICVVSGWITGIYSCWYIGWLSLWFEKVLCLRQWSWTGSSTILCSGKSRYNSWYTELGWNIFGLCGPVTVRYISLLAGSCLRTKVLLTFTTGGNCTHCCKVTYSYAGALWSSACLKVCSLSSSAPVVLQYGTTQNPVYFKNVAPQDRLQISESSIVRN
jgi:hypothetical protein